MGLVKLAVYGALGYLAYQMFFSDQPRSMGKASGGSHEEGRSRGNGGRPQQQPSGGQQMTGGGEGREEQTQEPSGTSMRHRVGRGVI